MMCMCEWGVWVWAGLSGQSTGHMPPRDRERAQRPVGIVVRHQTMPAHNAACHAPMDNNFLNHCVASYCSWADWLNRPWTLEGSSSSCCEVARWVGLQREMRQ
jgi:hypothetical protein